MGLLLEILELLLIFFLHVPHRQGDEALAVLARLLPGDRLVLIEARAEVVPDDVFLAVSGRDEQLVQVVAELQAVPLFLGERTDEVLEGLFVRRSLLFMIDLGLIELAQLLEPQLRFGVGRPGRRSPAAQAGQGEEEDQPDAAARSARAGPLPRLGHASLPWKSAHDGRRGGPVVPPAPRSLPSASWQRERTLSAEGDPFQGHGTGLRTCGPADPYAAPWRGVPFLRTRQWSPIGEECNLNLRRVAAKGLLLFASPFPVPCGRWTFVSLPALREANARLRLSGEPRKRASRIGPQVVR